MENAHSEISGLATCLDHERSDGHLVIVGFQDIERAYDIVTHAHVLLVLSQLSIHGRTYRWIANVFSRHDICNTFSRKCAEHAELSRHGNISSDSYRIIINIRLLAQNLPERAGSRLHRVLTNIRLFVIRIVIFKAYRVSMQSVRQRPDNLRSVIWRPLSETAFSFL